MMGLRLAQADASHAFAPPSAGVHEASMPACAEQATRCVARSAVATSRTALIASKRSNPYASARGHALVRRNLGQPGAKHTEPPTRASESGTDCAKWNRFASSQAREHNERRPAIAAR